MIINQNRGNNSGNTYIETEVYNDYSTKNTYSRENNESIKMIAEEHDLSDILKVEGIKLLLSCVPVVMSFILEIILNKEDSLMLGIIFVVGILATVYTLLRILTLSNLNKEGAFVESVSMKKLFKAGKRSRFTGDLYKKESGKILKLIGCKCPYCKTEPIGFMHFVYDEESEAFVLMCGENSKHVMPFDHKEQVM